MAGRRRVRLLAAILVFAVVAVIYTRRAPIQEYGSYVRENVVGGGSVLRGGEKGRGEEQQRPAVLPVTESEAIPIPTTTTPVTRSVARLVAGYTRTTEPPAVAQTTISHSSSSAPPTTSSSVPATSSIAAPQRLYHQLPAITDDDELPYEIGEGRVEVDVKSTTAAVHWTQYPEHFPISTTIQLPTGSPKPIPKIQHAGKASGKADTERLAAIKEATQHAWNGYREVAFGADEVKPISGGKSNPFNGWGATLVDTLDTLWIVGMMDEFDEAVEAVRDIDFTTSPRSDIPLFEVTIRYLGGLLAAYDVSGNDQAKYGILLDKAVELAEILYAAFDTPNRMPQTFYRWKPAFASQPHRAGNRVVLAELGSLSLEFTRLAQLTGEPKYYDAIARITDAFELWQNDTRLPGMWPTHVDASGCEKPAQMGSGSRTTRGGAGHQQPVPGGEGEMMHASEPVQQGGKDAGVRKSKQRQQQVAAQAELDLDNVMRRPGTGKIIGHGDPIPEGSLDGVDKEKLLNELGSAKKVKRQLEHLDDDHSIDEEKDELATAGSRNANSTAHRSDLRAPINNDARVGQDVCIPSGLHSSTKYGSETFTLGGQSDSTYEYLPKQYLLLGGLVEQYRSMYVFSADTARDNLLFRPMTVDNRDVLISGQLKVSVNTTDDSSVKHFQPEAEHLTCFAGGMFALGGAIFDRPEDVEIGRKLTDGCVWAYNSTTTGIMPEAFTAVKCEGLGEEECQWNQTEYWRVLDPYEETRTRVAPAKFVDEAVVAPKTGGVESSPALAALVAAETSMGFRPAMKEEVRKSEETRMVVGKRAVLDDIVLPATTAIANVLGGQATSSAAVEAPTTSSRRLLAAAAAETTSTITTPSRPIAPPPPAQPARHAAYTPKPPLPHSEFVQKKIEDERLPPGFVKIGSKQYLLRPEAIESVFYMYRITGEQYWRDMGWVMFTAIDTHTRALYGNSAIDDVTKMAPEGKDSMESFWTAETLKYFYLLFDEPGVWSLDEWVLNTEAHFFRRPS